MTRKLTLSIATLIMALGAALPVAALDLSAEATRRGGPPPPPPPPPSGTYYGWMSPDIIGAWGQNYFGQGVTVTVVDDFSSQSRFGGNFGDGYLTMRHGEWTSKEIGMLAPGATLKADDFSGGGSVSLSSGLNVLNLSYGMMATAGYNNVRWGRQESSIINYATNGTAVISKAAGNDFVAIGGVNVDGKIDYLGRDLVGTQSAIFVGALDHNGTTSAPTILSGYSNYAGSDTTVQAHFLVVGVDYGMTGLAGTSFAAPVISGYAAVLGSKFTSATPTQIVNQLLATARTDTLIANPTVCSWDNPAVCVDLTTAEAYGRGEASLSRALAPSAIH